MQETKCHKFWESNRNPITMKKCASDKKLHIHNNSKEYHVDRDKRYNSQKLEFNYTEENSTIINN